jgi:transcriptional antiterminator
MRNLEAEMKRYGISNADIQNLLGCTEKTVRNKLKGETVFTLPEAFLIKNKYFPGYRMEYLFAEYLFDSNSDARDSA